MITKDNAVIDEMFRVHIPGTVSSDFEYMVRSEIVDWIEENKQVLGMDMRDVIKLFWNERLN